MTTLGLTLIYLLAAVLGVVVCRSLKLPPVLAYLTAGVVLGPNALALANHSTSNTIHHLAEFGVVFLMFVIGLEFNLPKLRSMRRHVFVLGGAQTLLTMLLVMGLALALQHWLPRSFRLNWQSALVLGGALAMSSTAIIIKMLQDRGELASEQGRRSLGVLLFQDLAVVPLLVVIPALGSPPEAMAKELMLAGLKATAIIAFLLTGGQRIMQWWLTLVARRQSDELFILNILLTTLGLAWLTQMAGLSMALGAFIAGMLIAETPYRHQVETDIRPFYDVLLGLFFITIGMMLDWRLVLERPEFIVLLLAASLLLKLGIVFTVSRFLGDKSGVALRTSLYLAQAGEFGFVLLNLAQKQHLLSPQLLNPLLASMVVSMMLAPILIMQAERISNWVLRNEWLQQSLQFTDIARKSLAAQEHVLICGFGRCGQNMARLLEQQGIHYVALDLDPDRVQKAAQAGHAVVFGDAARTQVLQAAGLARAKAVAITYLETPNALKVLAAVRSLRPDLPVVVRTADDSTLDLFQQAGATEVVPEAIEGSLLLAVHALALMGVPVKEVIRIVQSQREARYAMLRGYFRGADDGSAQAHDREHLSTLRIEPGCWAEGQSVAALDLDQQHVVCLDVRRQGQSLPERLGTALLADDVLVLSGTPADLAVAEARLLRT
ncbi:MAG: monovalent cation:proton antiporter-2 (CPA2) family protein [Brachymonas sp.]